MTLLSIGDQIGPGTYPFHSAFRRALNFAHGGRLISVVTTDIGPGPLNIVIRGRLPDGGGSNTLPPLQIAANRLSFANRCLRFTPRHRYYSGFDFVPDNLRRRTVRSPAFRQWADQKGNGRLRRFHRNLAILRELLITKSPPRSLALVLDESQLKNFRSAFDRALLRQVLRGAHHVLHGHLLKGVRSLRGCGPGLTPGGDDFIAGILIGLYLLQILHGLNFRSLADRIFRAALGANIFSNTFLDLARRGLLFGRMKDLIQALLLGTNSGVRRAAGKLFAIGATSGADLATGFFVTVNPDTGASRLCRRADSLVRSELVREAMAESFRTVGRAGVSTDRLSARRPRRLPSSPKVRCAPRKPRPQLHLCVLPPIH